VLLDYILWRNFNQGKSLKGKLALTFVRILCKISERETKREKAYSGKKEMGYKSEDAGEGKRPAL